MTELPQKALDAIDNVDDPIIELDKAIQTLLVKISDAPINPEDDKDGKASERKLEAYRELSGRLTEIREAVIEARNDPTKLKPLYKHMVRFLERTQNMDEIRKYVQRIRRAVRWMLGMGWFERAKKEFEESGAKLAEVPPDEDLPE